MDHKINRFQELLPLIRKTTGWTLEDLGKKVDVSRQMISRLEKRHSKMTVMQYRALRQVFDEEIAMHPNETRILQDVLTALIDHPDKFSCEQKDKILSDANILAPSLVADMSSREKTTSLWDGALAGKMMCSMVSTGVFSFLPSLGSTDAIIAGAVTKLKSSNVNYNNTTQCERAKK